MVMVVAVLVVPIPIPIVPIAVSMQAGWCRHRCRLPRPHPPCHCTLGIGVVVIAMLLWRCCRRCRCPAGGAGAVVAGLMVASSMLRVLQVVMVSGELTGWYYLPCSSCQGRDLEKNLKCCDYKSYL